MPDGRIMPRSVPDGRGKNRKKRKLMAKIRQKFPLFYYGGKVALRFLHPINCLTFYGNSDMIAAGGWNKMENEKRKKKKKIAVTIFLLVAATACYSMMSSGSEKDLEIRNAASASEEETETTGESADTEEGNENVQEESGGREDSEETIPQIYVDVGGAVNTPRVVCIPEGARVFEAIVPTEKKFMFQIRRKWQPHRTEKIPRGCSHRRWRSRQAATRRRKMERSISIPLPPMNCRHWTESDRLWHQES